jgi:hypothetical protein
MFAVTATRALVANVPSGLVTLCPATVTVCASYALLLARVSNNARPLAPAQLDVLELIRFPFWYV